MSTVTEHPQSQKSRLKPYLITQIIIIAAMLVLGCFELYRRAEIYETSIMPYLGLFDVVGQLAFLTAIIHIVSQFWLTLRQRCVTTIAYLCLYVLTYAACSFAGDYHASRSGNHRWGNGVGLAVVDETMWHAKGVFWQPFVTIRGQHTFHATALGYFYCPLIQLDRRFWHDTFNYFEDDADEWLARHPEAS